MLQYLSQDLLVKSCFLDADADLAGLKKAPLILKMIIPLTSSRQLKDILPRSEGQRGLDSINLVTLTSIDPCLHPPEPTVNDEAERYSDKSESKPT